MTVGLEINNNSNQLLVHADGVGTACLGRASNQALVQPTTSSKGYSTYTFNSTQECAFVIDLPVGYSVGIVGVSFNGATYTITAYCGIGLDGHGFRPQSWVTIWAFAESNSTTTPQNFGLVLYNSVGQVAYNMTDPGISFLSAVGDFINSSTAIPALSRPVLMGHSEGYTIRYVSQDEASTYFRKTDSYNFAKRINSTTIISSLEQTFLGAPTTSPGSDSTLVPQGKFLIFEGANLP